MLKTFQKLLLTFNFLGAFCFSSIAFASNTNWINPNTGPTAGDWSVASNWDNGVPTLGSVAFIGSHLEANLTMSNEVADELKMTQSTLSISNTGVLTTNTSALLEAKINLAGTWTINSSSAVVDAGIININGGTWNSGPSIGTAGNQIVNINGGTWNANTSSLIGGGSTINLNSGTWNSGVTTIESGSTVNVNSGGTINSTSATLESSGAALVNGGSWDVTGAISLAGTGPGNLQIYDNGTVTADTLTLGNSSVTDSILNLGISASPNGTLAVNQLLADNSVGTANFNGGTLQALSNNPNFITGFSSGKLVTNSPNNAVIDSHGFNIGVADSGFSGNGGLTKIGAGTLTLSSTNTYLGGTTISGGTLQLGNGGATGSIVDTSSIGLSNNASLIFDVSSPQTYSQIISGAGSVTQEGSGTTTLTGTNTYTGDTTVSGGTLQLGNGGATGSIVDTSSIGLSNNASLIFDVSSPQTYSQIISGAGSVTQEGSGTTTLTGTNTYTEGTTVSGGTLELGSTGSVAGNMMINSGGTLSGYGTTGGDVTNNGTVSPGVGASIGTLTIGGNYTQASTGTYAVTLNQPGNSDLLNVGGIATLNNGLAEVIVANGFQPFTPYTILTANNVVGRFTLADPLFVEGELIYFPTHVDFEVAFNPLAFEAAAVTPNQQAVSNYILSTGGTAGIQTLIAGLTTNAQFQTAMDQISGATYANQTMAIAHVGSWFERELAARFMVLPSTDEPKCMCPNGQLVYKDGNKVKDGWVSLYGGQDSIVSGQVSGLNTNTTGVALGYEWPVGGCCQGKLGVGLGCMHFKGSATGSETANYSGNLFQAGIYGRYNQDSWSLGASVDVSGTNNVSAERQVQAATGVAIPTSTYQANLVSEQVALSYDLLNQKRCWKLRPFVGFINQQINRGGLTEQGDSGFELDVHSSSYHSARSQLGLLWEAPINYRVRPFASADWEHEFSDRNSQFNAQLTGVTSPETFHVVGGEVGRDSGYVRAGLILVQQGKLNISLLYQGQFAKDWQQNGAALEANLLLD